MTEKYKFSELQQAWGFGGTLEVSFNDVFPKPEVDTNGKPVPVPIEKVKLDREETLSLLRPYASVRFKDQLRAVVPLAVYLALFQILVLRQLVENSLLITAGLFAVIVGLMFFMEGLRIGLMPFGETIGSSLPRRSQLPVGRREKRKKK